MGEVIERGREIARVKVLEKMSNKKFMRLLQVCCWKVRDHAIEKVLEIVKVEVVS
jgi:hypothetical protein